MLSTHSPARAESTTRAALAGLGWHCALGWVRVTQCFGLSDGDATFGWVSVTWWFRLYTSVIHRCKMLTEI